MIQGAENCGYTSGVGITPACPGQYGKNVTKMGEELEQFLEKLRGCNKPATHEYFGKGTAPFKRHRARKYKCGTLLRGRRLLCDDCSKSFLVWLGLLDPPK
jgi:hypothetical protein